MTTAEPSEFLGVQLLSTFGNCEAEAMAAQIVDYCADAGTWKVDLLQLRRLARLADLVDGHVMNNGYDNGHHASGLDLLVEYGWIGQTGVAPAFVERLVKARPAHRPSSQIRTRCQRAVTVLVKHESENGE